MFLLKPLDLVPSYPNNIELIGTILACFKSFIYTDFPIFLAISFSCLTFFCGRTFGRVSIILNIS